MTSKVETEEGEEPADETPQDDGAEEVESEKKQDDAQDYASYKVAELKELLSSRKACLG